MLLLTLEHRNFILSTFDFWPSTSDLRPSTSEFCIFIHDLRPQTFNMRLLAYFVNVLLFGVLFWPLIPSFQNVTSGLWRFTFKVTWQLRKVDLRFFLVYFTLVQVEECYKISRSGFILSRRTCRIDPILILKRWALQFYFCNCWPLLPDHWRVTFNIIIFDSELPNNWVTESGDG